MFLVSVVTIFPEMFPGPLSYGLSGKAMGSKWKLQTINIRDFTQDKHKTVDDTPFGGGPGMIMRPDIVHNAMMSALALYDNPPNIVFMSPRGKIFTQKIAKNLVLNTNGLIILCGRYEGIDERVIEYWKENHNMLEISIGDYILFGGEIPALVLIDACVRLINGVIKNPLATIDESFSLDCLEYPQYTKPRVWCKRSVPDVLLSGNHAQILEWKRKESMRVTSERRPDLLCRGDCNEFDRANRS